jgi:hypothetical protein
LCRALKACVFSGFQIVCFQRPFKDYLYFSKTLIKIFFALLSCECSACFTCRVASSLETRLLSSLLPVPASSRPRQSCDANARFPRNFFRNEALNAVLHISELSDQLDLTLGTSKIIQLDTTVSHLKRCSQIRIMQFIQTILAQSASARLKATALCEVYVYKLSLFRVVCLLNRW